MECPRDRTPLRKWRIDHIDSHICPQCAGLFIELNQKGADVLSHSNIRPAERKRIPADGEMPLPSPATGAPMIPFLYRRVEVDYCEESNAVWFDPGEIQKVDPKAKKAQDVKSSLKSIKNRSNGLSGGVLDGIDAGLTLNLDLVGDFIGGVFDAF